MPLTGRELGLGMRGDDVAELHRGLTHLGFEVLEPELDEQRFGDATAEIVRGFQERAGLEATGTLDLRTAAAIQDAVDRRRARVVHGHVRSRDGGPLARARVIACDERFGGVKELESGTTGEDGGYQLVYRIAEPAADGHTTGLVIRVHDEAGGVLAASPVLFAPTHDEVVDLEVADGARAPAEYDRLRLQVEAVLDGTGVGDLLPEHVAFVASAARLEHDRVGALVSAVRDAGETGLPAGLLYGLFRQDVPQGVADLLAQPSETLGRAFDDAMRQNLIPAEFAERRDELLKGQLAPLQVEALLSPAATGDRASLGDVLATVIDRPDQRAAFARIALERPVVGAEFWTRLRDTGAFEDAELRRTQDTLDLAALTGGHLPALVELQRRAAADAGLRTPRGFSSYDEGEWRRVAAAAGPPPGTEGRSDRERVAAYGRTLARAFERRFPTAVIAARIKADAFPTPAGVRADLELFFERNPAFELGNQDAEAFTAPGGGGDLTGIPDERRPNLLAELRRLERVVKVVPVTAQGDGPRHATAAALLREGLDSAHRIARLGRDEVATWLGGLLDGGEEEALAVHERAQEVASVTVALMTKYGQALQPVDLPMVPSTATAPVPPPAPGSGVPDLRTLFGNLDFCGCDHCRSVLSPAAYLVDLLRFLDDRKLPGGGTLAAAVLDPQRRPDLAQIELTCENTNRRMPYVDLACEVLEQAVAPRPAQARFPQTTWTEAELGASPEHLHVPAYDVLRAARYPWSLPFDLALEEARATLAQVDLRRFDLMQLLRAPARLTSHAIAFERLGISAAEGTILTTAQPAAAWEDWGLDQSVLGLRDQRDASTVSGAWDAVLRDRVSILLQQSGLSHADLLGVLDTRYVNPAREAPTTQGHDCDVSRMSAPWLTAAELARTHRFVRLWRRLGWSLRDTDRAIAAFGGDIRPDMLLWLAHVEQLRTILRVPAATVLGWWGTLDAHVYADHAADGVPQLPSLYDRAFLDPAVSNPPPAALALNAARTELAAPWTAQQPGRTVSSQRAAVAAGVGLDGADLARLLGDVVPDQLNLANLSALHAIATLARAARVTVRDFQRVRRLTGIDPLQTGIPKPAAAAEAIRFVEALVRIRASGFTLAELDFLLAHRFSATDGVALPDDQAARMLADLRDGLRRIEDEVWAPPDPAGEHTRRFLGRLGWDDAVVALATGEGMLARDPRTETPLESLPAGVQLGAQLSGPLRARVGYDVARKRLWFLGTMRNAERDELKALPQAPQSANGKAFTRAVTKLYSQSRTELKARQDFLGKRMQSFRLPAFTAPVTLTAPLAAVPAGVVLPDDLPAELRNRLTHDAQAGTLTCAGLLAAAEEAKAAGLAPADAAWTGALAVMRAEPAVPPALATRFAYDPGSASLHLVGWLDEGDRQLLRELAQPPGYKAAVDALFAAAAGYREADSANRFLTAADASRLIFDSRSTEDRFGIVLGILLPYLRRQASEALAVHTLAGALGLAPEIAGEALLRRLTSPGRAGVPAIEALLTPAFASTPASVSITPTAFPDQFVVLARLHKVALMLGRVGLTPQEAIGLLGSTDWAAFDALPVRPQDASAAGYASWQRLSALRELKTVFPAGADVLMAILKAAVTAQSSADVHAVLEPMLGWSTADVIFLSQPGRLDLPGPASFADPMKLLDLVAAFTLLGRLGVPAAQAWTWVDAQIAQSDAGALRQAVRARVDATTWLEQAKQLRDGVRNHQRDALVTYLMAHERLRDTDELHGRYLIDVQMDSCMPTSRIRQAIASVQLFVQRCLLNLEAGVSPSAIPADQWRWLKTYRLWEAGRKVLLQPQRFLAPELRDDKSLFFRQLEGELGQGDLTATAAEAAFGRYVEKLERVARLEIVGACWQQTPDGATLHVFARTFNTPNAYFYRRLVASAWTAWEPVELDIEGEHVLPVIFNEELFVFWTRFKEKAFTPDPPPTTPKNPDKRLELQLAWSRYKDGRWQATQLLDQPMVTVRPEVTPSSSFFLAPFVQGDVLTIACGHPKATGSIVGYSWNLARLIGGRGRLTIDQHAAFNFLPTPLNPGVPHCLHVGNALVEASVIGQLPLKVLFAPALGTGGYDRAAAQPIEVLSRVPAGPEDRFRTVYPIGPESFHEESGQIRGALVAQDSLFFEDRRRTYFAAFVEWVDYLSFWLAFLTGHTNVTEAQFRRQSLHFQLHFHPWASEFARRLATGGLDALLSLETQQLSDAGANFRDQYRPRLGPVLPIPQGAEDVDFGPRSAYGVYNWELFFHAPLTVATRLVRNQRFEEALRWMHKIFDPLTNVAGPEPGRFWNVLPFHRAGQGTPIQELLELLADKTDQSQARKDLVDQVRRWRRTPFNAHAIARWRTTAYQRYVVMAYVDLVVAWGDQLFRRDTAESLNEATQLYLLADRVLGRPPERIRRRTRPVVHTYASLAPKLDDLSNALVAAESLVPTGGGGASGGGTPPPPLTLYFCVPQDDQLLERWDRVADRLYKIRHCMNLDGVERQLPLFDPPLDPAVLVQAAAAGVDIGAVLNEAGAPASPYRFSVLAQKTTELCADVKGLGAQLLAALERRDAEALNRLRSGQELTVLESARGVKAAQEQEARMALDVLGKSAEAAETRLQYYCGLLLALERVGVPGPGVARLGDRLAGDVISAIAALAPGAEAAKAALQLAATIAPQLRESLDRLQQAMSPSAQDGPGETVAVPLSALEKRHMEELASSNAKQLRAQEYEALASVLALIPDITIGAQGVSSPVVQAQIGGTLISTVARLKGSAFNYEAGQHAYKANLHSIIGGHQRRASEWLHQANLALKDAEHIGKQAIAAGVRLRAATLELTNHDRQIQHARETDALVQDKFTNEELFDWLSNQVAAVYLGAYQLAYDMAKRTERAFRFELGAPDASFVKFGSWDSLFKGLLAGERLHQDVRRMEVAHLDQHRRGPELIKHVALSVVDPGALIQLRLSGSCEVEVPEALFDLDHAGHYHRRIRSVSISLPCVAGAYTGVNGTLTKLRSSTRVSPALNGGYARATDPAGAPADDPRFADEHGVESIAFSTGRMDAGALDGDGERYMPFENCGVISRWRIELPRDFRPFPYDSISDAILHIRYSARSGGRRLGDAAGEELSANLNTLMRGADGSGGFSRLFSVRHELDGWHSLVSDTGARSMDLAVDGRFPLLFGRRPIAIDRVDLLLHGLEPLDGALAELRKARLNGTAVNTLAVADGEPNTLRVGRPKAGWDPAAQSWKLSFVKVDHAAVRQIDDAWLLCHYTVG